MVNLKRIKMKFALKQCKNHQKINLKLKKQINNSKTIPNTKKTSTFPWIDSGFRFGPGFVSTVSIGYPFVAAALSLSFVAAHGLFLFWNDIVLDYFKIE